MTAPALPKAGFGPAAFLVAWPLGAGQPDGARLATLAARVWGAFASIPWGGGPVRTRPPSRPTRGRSSFSERKP